MVRLSTNNDINGIISVWKEAFGDSESDIRFFLDEHFKPDNTVISECEGEVASVLFLLFIGNMCISQGSESHHFEM